MKSERAGMEANDVAAALTSAERGIRACAKRDAVDLRAVAAAAVEENDARRRELIVAALEAEVRQRAALPAAYLCEGIID